MVSLYDQRLQKLKVISIILFLLKELASNCLWGQHWRSLRLFTLLFITLEFELLKYEIKIFVRFSKLIFLFFFFKKEDFRKRIWKHFCDLKKIGLVSHWSLNIIQIKILTKRCRNPKAKLNQVLIKNVFTIWSSNIIFLNSNKTLN